MTEESAVAITSLSGVHCGLVIAMALYALSAPPAWRLRSCSVPPFVRVEPLPPPSSAAVVGFRFLIAAENSAPLLTCRHPLVFDAPAEDSEPSFVGI